MSNLAAVLICVGILFVALYLAWPCFEQGANHDELVIEDVLGLLILTFGLLVAAVFLLAREWWWRP